MLELFHKGGPLMYPILLCSVLALAIFFERLLTYVLLQRRGRRLYAEVDRMVLERHLTEARALCAGRPFLLSDIFLVALQAAGRSRERLKTLVEEVGSRRMAELERYLGLLGTIAAISPLLGLLGTVLGMIRAFTELSLKGVGTPETLGGGISEALITTATGLSVAIPVILLHKYLTSRADRIAADFEDYSLRLVDRLADDLSEPA
ncbi:MotA/TolQ/ExbB proton channel family protein [Desulfuromonas thiophila]|jgi:biopolymer transport protein ExbB|uniref:Biopolymer transport protein ExbB n=1 Tax=Desulfuromonas thiophila TaxID=57664 RepID=A0A1G7AIF5_9BACT|nr:MotA/TolQ/ExbB proton channel family protein [Desulfuromonas thiophila]MCK9172571.1 MotA/TolQ/ExbB proton channel family protein [Desulfuromonas thiophila]MDD3801354.1 MotA/TolQ/ExbB proton channel family protein [Desulfuromonas thiophila]MDY0398092.1 MotA/TolQ/ExbB proton channel family protein [Desulfuromonas thiophila]SDE14552.1 biopolymer transport protein ExbB [Desulfuromonas thiophila]